MRVVDAGGDIAHTYGCQRKMYKLRKVIRLLTVAQI